jgi:hypothetical protein
MKPWFAWYPVGIDDKWVWLKMVQRERRYLFNSYRAVGYPITPVVGYWIYSNA